MRYLFDSAIHALSFDVEEHFQVSAFASPIRRRHWDQFDSRVERNTKRICDLLALNETQATFFILGWVAERHPALVKYLADAGHEIASHGYGHELVTLQTPALFREDVRRAKNILEDLTGRPILGYRAPSFTITGETSWALSVLAEEGYLYDSSVYRRFSNGDGSPESCVSYHLVQTAGGPLWEVPLSTIRAWRLYVPVAGGGYFRLLPYQVLKALLKRIELQGSQLVMYLHPWEIDPDQPRMQGPLMSQFRHYLNLSKTEARLRCLLQDFRFGPIAEVVKPICDAYAPNGAVAMPLEEVAGKAAAMQLRIG